MNGFLQRRERDAYSQRLNGNLSKPKTESTNSKFSSLEKYHDLAVKGDKEAVKTAYELAQKLYEENPNNHLAEAYVGSTTSLLGRDAVEPGERMKLAMQGVKILDRAVNSDPQNINIRILRGYVCYRLPEMFFHKTSTAIEDFKYLSSRYEENNSIFNQEFYWQILYDLGTAYKNIFKQQECDRVWNKLLSLTSDSKYHSIINKTSIANNAAATSNNNTQDWDQKKNLISESVELHYRASLEGMEAKTEAAAFFEKAYRENPGNPLIAAYYADCMSMAGYESKDSSSMFSNAIKAMKIFDEAVYIDPDALEVRFLRAYHSFRLPEAFFKRTATTITDLEYLVKRYEKDPSIFPRELYGDTLFMLGKAYSRMDMWKEAEIVWKKLNSANINPIYKKLVSEELNKNSLNINPINSNRVTNKKLLLENGIKLHDLAVAGNKKASKEAFEIMKRIFENYPDDPVVEGYYGSTMALAARDSGDPGIMFSNAIKGMQHLKRAVSKSPYDPKLRLLRGYLMYNLPEVFFHLSGKAAKDFRFLKSAYERDNKLFSKELYWQILYDLGVCYKNSGEDKDAETIWRKLLKECPDCKYKDSILRMGGELVK